MNRHQFRITVATSLFCFAFAAGIASGQTATPKAASAPKSAAAPKPMAAPTRSSTDTLGRIKAARTINVAFSGDSLPFSFVESNMQPSGYSIDLCKRVIAQIGNAVEVPELKVNWMVGTVSERLAMVASGKVDIDCANTTMTLSRLSNVDFSSLIFVEGGGFLVRDAALQKFADLNGKTIGVIAGTTTETRLAQAMKARLVNAKVVKVKEGNEGLAMLESGALDAFASDKIKLIGLASQAKDPGKLAMLGEDLSFEPLAFALPRGDPAFRLEVNKALTRIYSSPDIEAIFSQWLGKLGRPSGLLAAMYVLNSIPD